MVLQKKDFIEIEFTAKTKEGNIFDSNLKENLEKESHKEKARPFVFGLGEDMFLKGIEESLIGKDIGKHVIKLSPENAFGKRDPKLIQTMPIKIFHAEKLNPVPGAMFNFDGKVARVLTVSGGRVMVDFNNPLAGKEVVYEINVLRKVEDLKEKVSALNDFLFRQEFKFEIKGNNLSLEVPKGMKQFAEMFKDKYKDIFGLEMVAEEIDPPTTSKSREDTNKKKKKIAENKEETK